MARKMDQFVLNQIKIQSSSISVIVNIYINEMWIRDGQFV